MRREGAGISVDVVHFFLPLVVLKRVDLYIFVLVVVLYVVALLIEERLVRDCRETLGRHVVNSDGTVAHPVEEARLKRERDIGVRLIIKDSFILIEIEDIELLLPFVDLEVGEEPIMDS